jgi:glutaredoxin
MNTVTMYSKVTCPFCVHAEQLEVAPQIRTEL